MKTIKLINEIVSKSDPSRYDNVSYTKYYRDLSSISDSIVNETQTFIERDRKIMVAINNLPNSPEKKVLLEIFNQI